MFAAERVPEESAPAAAIAFSRRSAAATGADDPSSAQLSPPNAIIDAPSALWANTIAAPRLSVPPATAAASDQKTATLAPSTSSRLQTIGLSRSRVASY